MMDFTPPTNQDFEENLDEENASQPTGSKNISL